MDPVVKRVLQLSFFVVVVLLLWGILGGIAAQDIGVTCDVGLSDVLCWKWHTNIIGELGQLFS